MKTQKSARGESPLFIPQSTTTTESNKTGSWRFLRPRYDEKTAPCSSACPAGEDIGRIEMLAAQGLFKEAWETILRENPLPAVCGRVCFHPCETVCNRGEFDQPIAIHTLERFLADTATRYNLKPDLDRLPTKKQRVAVVGAGPSGLSAAYFLSRLGYGCDVFESMPEPGGVLRWGIPPYRLPASIVRQEVERIQELGCTIQCGKPVSRRFLEEAAGTYDAVFMGCGISRIPRLNIPGEDLEGMSDGLEFLRRVNMEEAPTLRGTVAVIGGGNTAIDVVRSVARLGAKPLLVYRRRRQDMPAFDEEIAMALEEGVDLLELRAPIRVERSGEEYVLTLQEMQVFSPGEEGKAQVRPVPDKTETLRVSRIYKAIGLEVAEDWYNPPGIGKGIHRFSRSVLVQPPKGPVIAFGGDLTTDIKSVVDAVASGKEAAMALDVLFQEGMDAVSRRLKKCVVGHGPSLSVEVYMAGPRCQRNSHVVQYSEINSDHFQLSPRIPQPRLLRQERVASFAEIDLKISANVAIREAERCFNCGLCNQCDNCRLFCPDLAVAQDASSFGRRINYDYCKGCGICVVECPRNAMALEEEKAQGA